MLLIAIPALNEAGSIASVILDVKEHLPEAKILVIDDGSTDETAKIAKDSGAMVLSMPFNVGVGGALRLAFRYAAENNFDAVLQIDADGQHLQSEAESLIQMQHKGSIVIGSRFANGFSNYQVSLTRKFAMKTLALIISKICRTKLTDVTSGFRLTTGKAIKEFATSYPRDYLGDTVESLILANKLGLKVTEVPVKMQPRQSGKPSQNSVKSIWYLFRTILVIFLSLIRKQKD